MLSLSGFSVLLDFEWKFKENNPKKTNLNKTNLKSVHFISVLLSHKIWMNHEVISSIKYVFPSALTPHLDIWKYFIACFKVLLPVVFLQLSEEADRAESSLDIIYISVVTWFHWNTSGVLKQTNTPFFHFLFHWLPEVTPFLWNHVTKKSPQVAFSNKTVQSVLHKTERHWDNIKNIYIGSLKNSN